LITIGPLHAIRSTRVVTPTGIAPASLWVRGGRIVDLREHDDVPSDAPLQDHGDHVLMPGLVDTHVHVNEPGRTEWEGWLTATRAAAAGGVTTLEEMPLNSIPALTSVAAFQQKAAACEGKLFVDSGLWGGVVPGNEGELEGMWRAGVWGFKCFMAPSGVPEFGHVGEPELRRALPVLRELGAPLLVHAESPRVLAEAAPALRQGDPRSHAGWLASRPPAAEVEAAELLVRLCREFGVRIHVVHVSAAQALRVLQAAREEGLPMGTETCPHYLHFAAEEIPDGATELKCAPPIRDAANREDLWSGLGAGWIDLIASDHSPSPPELKLREEGDIARAWGGIASLQLGASVVWRGAREHGYTASELSRWMSAAPARLAGLQGRKGGFAPGHDADLVVFDPDTEFLVQPSHLFHRHPLCPYVGSVLPGVVRETWLRGEPVYRAGEVLGEPRGVLLRRGEPA
jgi:allantoinase